jgi:Amt family ammonium transporter
MGSMAVGFGAAAICYLAVTVLKPMLGYDDSLDAFGVHGVGGMWGAIASGLFAVTLGSGIESNAQQLMVQLKGVAFVAVFAPLATVLILGGLKLVFGSLRVEDEAEHEGLDLAEHSESAYVLSTSGTGTLMERQHGSGLGLTERSHA